MAERPRAGRPRASSQRMLEEAASELFVENGYAKTTIEQITQRAGVSRNTFFNYFGSKSELLWVELDASLGVLTEALAERATATDPLGAVEDALLVAAAAFTPQQAPLVLTQYEVMGIDAELKAAGLARALAHADLIERYLVVRLWAGHPEVGSAGAGDRGSAAERPLLARAVALAVLGAAAAAVGRWAADGPGRAPLVSYVERAVHPVIRGFGQV